MNSIETIQDRLYSYSLDGATCYLKHGVVAYIQNNTDDFLVCLPALRSSSEMNFYFILTPIVLFLSVCAMVCRVMRWMYSCGKLFEECCEDDACCSEEKEEVDNSPWQRRSPQESEYDAASQDEESGMPSSEIFVYPPQSSTEQPQVIMLNSSQDYGSAEAVWVTMDQSVNNVIQEPIRTIESNIHMDRVPSPHYPLHPTSVPPIGPIGQNPTEPPPSYFEVFSRVETYETSDGVQEPDLPTYADFVGRETTL